MASKTIIRSTIKHLNKDIMEARSGIKRDMITIRKLKKELR